MAKQGSLRLRDALPIWWQVARPWFAGEGTSSIARAPARISRWPSLNPSPPLVDLEQSKLSALSIQAVFKLTIHCTNTLWGYSVDD
jgi:hypothetical protein